MVWRIVEDHGVPNHHLFSLHLYHLYPFHQTIRSIQKLKDGFLDQFLSWVQLWIWKWKNGKLLQSNSIALDCEWQQRTNRKNKQWDKCGGVMAVVLSFQKGFAFTRQRIVWLCNRVSYVMIQKATGKQWRCVRGYSFSVGTAFLRVYTFLWVQQLPGYNVTVILALTSQQILCTVQQGGSVDLASEWQLKHLCLQTGRRLTESYYRNHWARSWFNQKNRDPPSAETKSHPGSEIDATSLPSFSFVLNE